MSSPRIVDYDRFFREPDWKEEFFHDGDLAEDAPESREVSDEALRRFLNSNGDRLVPLRFCEHVEEEPVDSNAK